MKKISILCTSVFVVLLGLMVPVSTQAQLTNVFVNEIHYDNDGPDLNETIEIAGPAGTDLSDYLLYLYNGSGGLTYAPGNPFYLTGVIPDQGNGFGTVCFAVPGIQNGTPDGLAIVYFPTGALYPVVVQFISYEGFFPANNGPAVGDTSQDIGVSESTTSPVGYSLQLGGFGSTYEDFMLTGGWQAASIATCGQPNNNQTFMVLDYCTNFLDFWMMEQTGPAIIDTVNNTVNIEVLTGTDLTQLLAYFNLCWFAEVTDTASGTEVESGDFPRDFSSPVVWRIDNLKPSRLWTIIVTEQVPEMVINEVDYEQPSTDISEFIELKNNSSAAVNITGMQLKLIDGSTSLPYATLTLPSFSLAAGDYFVICGNAVNTMNCDWDVSPDANLIMNGAPSAIALYTQTGSLVDALSYEGDIPAFSENGGTSLADPELESRVGLSRYPDGADTDDNGADFGLLCITPGYANTFDTIPCICTITGVSLSSTLPCDSMTSTFDAYITVTYSKAPGSGYLVVNGVNYAVSGSPQTVLLQGIPAMAGPVAVEIHFSENPSCSWFTSNLFTSPDPCGKCYVVNVWGGNQSACAPATNFYTQDIHVEVMFNPGGPWVVTIGGVSDTVNFVPLTGNTGILTVSGLISDGAPVSGSIRNLMIPGCIYTLAGEWNAPANCYDSPEIVVNEVDYDQPGTDGAEFIELRNNEAFAVNLDGYFVQLINGGTGLPYDKIWLPDVDLLPGDYFVMCANPLNTDNCDLDLGTHLNLSSLAFSIDNGAPDAIALHDLFGTMVDVVSYEGDVAGYVETTGLGLEDDGIAEGHGISRYVDGMDTDNNALDFKYRCITPGEPNTYLYGYCGPFHSLDLLVRYKNLSGTIMPGVHVNVTEAKGAVGNYTSDNTGWLTIDSLKNISYNFGVDASAYPWGWGGVNSLDALLIARHFTTLQLLSGDFFNVADVIGSNGANSADAQRVAMRFAMGEAIYFDSGDWYPVSKEFSFNAPESAQFTDTLELLCYGDVNGSHVPTAPIKASSVSLSQRGTLAPEGDWVELPVYIGQPIDLGAISLSMRLPEGIMVEDVRMADNSDVYFMFTDNVLTLSWFSLNGMKLQDGDEFMRLSLRSVSPFGIGEIGILPGTEFGNVNGEEVPGVKMMIPAVGVTGTQINLWPNPASNQARIWFATAKAGSVDIEVLTMLGQPCGVAISRFMEAGEHTLSLDLGQLPEGSYLLRYSSQGETQLKPLVIVR